VVRSRPRGRPRDPSIDTRVLAATRHLLVGEGFNGTTIQAIAARSGVPASAIYRRWTSRVEIIEQAVFPGGAPVRVRPTGDLHGDLRRFVRAYLAVFEAPAARAAMPALLANYQATGRSGAAETWSAVSGRPQFAELLRAAPPGNVDRSLDADDVFDLIIGAMVARVLIPTVADRNRSIEQLVDLISRALRPEAG
jgi:AcrR family transcriptional regulator